MRKQSSRPPEPVSSSASVPPWPRTSSAAITSPSPEPPCRTPPRNGWNRLSRAFCGRPGPVSATRISVWPAASRAATVTAPGRPGRLDRLRGVAHQVRRAPGTAGRRRRAPRRPGGDVGREARRRPSGVASRSFVQHLVDQRREREDRELRRRLLGPAEGQRALAEADRARRASRRASARCARTPGSALASMRSARICAVVSRLRRSWLILATAAAERRQPLLLPQRAGQPHLQVVQRRLGLRQLARAALRAR